MDGKISSRLDWENLRHFLALARHGTLLGAARALKVEHATVSRRVAMLEKQLQTKLVDRRGRKITLTAEGERIAAMATRMDEEALAIAQAGRNKATQLAGDLRISAPPALASALLVEPIARLRRLHPEINVTVVGEKRYASLDRREADIAVRLARPEQGDLTVMRIGSMGFRFYASPAYIAATPPDDWTFIAYDEDMDASPQQRRLLEIARGRRIALRSSTLEFQLAAAKAGCGIVILPDFLVGDVAGLMPVLEEEEPVRRDIWLVVHSAIRDLPIIRAVLDVLKA